MEACFPCSDAWIDGVFDQLLDWRPNGTLRHTPVGAAPWMVAFLVHDSFDHADQYLLNVARFHRLAATGRFACSLEAVHQAASFRALRKALDVLTGLSVAIHGGGMRINTANAFSREFRPPAPHDAERAMRRLIFRRRALISAGKLSAGGALASYLVFLTIHLLGDGNGRSARMMFAADCLVVSPEDAAQKIMALMMLHQMRGRSFHLAAACTRAGDASMVATCFDHAITDSDPLLDALEVALAGDADAGPGAAPIRELHRMLDMRLGIAHGDLFPDSGAAPHVDRDAAPGLFTAARRRR